MHPYRQTEGFVLRFEHGSLTAGGGKMFLALAIFLIILSLILHELGHAWMMHKRGVQFDRVGLGIPISFLPSFKFGLKRWPGVSFEIHPLIIGAFVAITEEGQKKIKELSFGDQAQIFGGGIVVNLLYAALMIFILLFSSGRSISQIVVMPHFYISAIVALLCLFANKFFCKYLLLPIGVALIGLIIWSITKDPAKAMVGPVGIISMVGKHSITFLGAISITGLISLALGLTNALPLYPLDGGHIMGVLLEKWTKNQNVLKGYNRISGILFILLIIFAFSSDFINLL